MTGGRPVMFVCLQIRFAIEGGFRWRICFNSTSIPKIHCVGEYCNHSQTLVCDEQIVPICHTNVERIAIGISANHVLEAHVSKLIWSRWTTFLSLPPPTGTTPWNSSIGRITSCITIRNVPCTHTHTHTFTYTHTHTHTHTHITGDRKSSPNIIIMRAF